MALILVAEDEDGVRKLVTTLLKSAGHETLAASDGMEAVSMFRTWASGIDLVLTDLRMPLMSGQQVVEHIRVRRPDVPIVCMTGYSEEQVPDGIALLTKPFSPKMLLDVVERTLP